MTDWAKELRDLVATAKTPEEENALKAFQASIGPYLEDPKLLRTLLSKIAQEPMPNLHLVLGEREFASIDDLQAAVAAGVKVAASL
jgi:hypothetical protein